MSGAGVEPEGEDDGVDVGHTDAEAGPSSGDGQTDVTDGERAASQVSAMDVVDGGSMEREVDAMDVVDGGSMEREVDAMDVVDGGSMEREVEAVDVVGGESAASPVDVPDAVAGESILRAARLGTVLFVAVAVAAAVSRPVFSTAAVVVSLVLFTAGCVAFLWAYAVAVGRSRVDAIGMGGLFFLQNTAPRRVQLLLIGATAVQVVAAVATAAVHPFTTQAFVILGPMYGLGLAGLWGAMHGRFGSRSDEAER